MARVPRPGRDDSGVDAAVVPWLASAAGREAVASVRGLTADSLARSAALRKSGLDAAQAAAVLEQADLLERAVAGGVVDGLANPLPLLTRDGLEQGTRAVIARRRAALFAVAGARTVVDLSAGLGFDAAAVVRAGLRSVAIERDPAVAALLAHNLGMSPTNASEVRLFSDPAETAGMSDPLPSGDATGTAGIVGDATQMIDDLLAVIGPEDVVFVDPARRVAGRRSADGARALPERDPEQWSPSLSWVVALAARHSRIVIKVNPGFAHERVPDGWHAEWVSVGGVGVETTLWSFDAIPRRQVVVVRDGVLPSSVIHEFAGDTDARAETTDEIGAFLIEPDDVFGPSGLVDALAVSLNARRVGDTLWLTSNTPVETPFARTWRVVEELPAATKALRQALAERGIGNVTVKSKAAGVDAGTVRRDLRLTKGAPGAVVLLRATGTLRAILVDRA